MEFGIKEIRLKSLSLDNESKSKLTGSYEVISTNDKVLATQPFNTYGGIDVAFSPAVLEALKDLREVVSKDLITTLGA